MNANGATITERLAGRPGWFVHSATAAQPPGHEALAAMLLALGCEQFDCPATVDTSAFTHRRLTNGATLVHEGAPVEALYVVQAGTLKCVRTAEDGYEHVLGFVGRGEVIGFDGLGTGHHASAAVALEDTSVVMLPLALLPRLREQIPQLAPALEARLSRQFARLGETVELMAALSAEVRLARFLVQLSQRMAESGQSPRRLRLRMGRRDIASHLGLAHETVSRSFRMLADEGLLCVNNREVEILDPAGLKACARNTRNAAEEPPRRAQGAHGAELAAA